MFDKALYEETQKIIAEECRKSLSAIDGEQVADYLKLILSAEKVFFVGVGRVLLTLECVAKRYAHLGIQVVVVGQITEPAITNKDVLVVGSGSGKTLFSAGIARKAKGLGAKVIHIGSNPNSGISEIVDLFVRIPVDSKAKMEDEIPSKQPMTSLFEQTLLLFGDTTAMMIIKEKQIDIEKLWEYHANLE